MDCIDIYMKMDDIEVLYSSFLIIVNMSCTEHLIRRALKFFSYEIQHSNC